MAFKMIIILIINFIVTKINFDLCFINLIFVIKLLILTSLKLVLNIEYYYFIMALVKFNFIIDKLHMLKSNPIILPTIYHLN